MPSTVYAPADLPVGTSWVYTLSAQDAINQCHVLGIVPASTLTVNRNLLSDFLNKLKLNGGSEPTPENLRPDLTAPVGVPISNSGLADKTIPNVPVSTTENVKTPESPPVTTSITQVTQAATTVVTPSQQIPVSTPLPGSNSVSADHVGSSQSTGPSVLGSGHLPQVDWTQLVQATALAVGQQVAAAMSSAQSPSKTGNSKFKVLDDLVRALPITSGTEPRKLVQFLVATTKIGNLSLFNNEDLLLAVLPRTSEQLRVFWLKGISERAKLDQLVASVRDFFLPGQIRHAVITTMVYRIQEPTESLPEFVESISGTSALLIPQFSQQDVLDTVLNGLNRATRAALAAFPAACTLSDLLALVPRVQVVRALEEEQAASRANDSQRHASSRPNLQQMSNNASYNTNYRQNNQRNNNYRQNNQHSTNYRPNNQHNTQFFSGTPYNPHIPQFPYHQYQGQETRPDQSALHHQPNRQFTPRNYGQGNGRGGQR